MIELPNFEQAFDHENNFYLSCAPARIGKTLAHYELFKMSLAVPGAIVECGTFKGASLARFAAFRSLLEDSSRKILAFDIFGSFPETEFAADREMREDFIKSAGGESISVNQMMEVLANKNCSENVELVAGDICKTVPKYVQENPAIKIALLNLDTDIYEPAVAILDYLYPRLEPGGVLILDDYGVFPGETKAVDDYFAGQPLKIRRFPFAATPSYLVKE